MTRCHEAVPCPLLSLWSRADVSPGAPLIRVSDRHGPKEEILCTGKG